MGSASMSTSITAGKFSLASRLASAGDVGILGPGTDGTDDAAPLEIAASRAASYSAKSS